MPDIDPTTLTDEQLAAILREAGRRAATRIGELRKRVDRTCETCGTIMENVTTRKRFCSANCRVKAYYWQKRARTDPAAAHRLRLQAKGWLPTTRGD